MIGTIVNQYFGNTFNHQNGRNQQQHTHKNTSKQYQPISYQITRTSPIKYLEEDCLGWGLNKKGMRELLMQHD